MLKYIQDILQNLLKEVPKQKIKFNNTRTNSSGSSKRNTSIHPGILAPVSDENHKFESTHDVLKIKKTYDMLMKKLISPNLELIPQSNKLLQQIISIDIKKQQEMFSSLFPNKLFDKARKKKLPGAPFDRKIQEEEKAPGSSSINHFAIGWSGQATTKELLKPLVEVSSKHHYDFDSAFFDYTDIKVLNTKKTGVKHTKQHKKIRNRRKKPIPHPSTNMRKPKDSFQVIERTPKTHIGELHRLSAEKRKTAFQQTGSEPSQGINISDFPTTETITEDIESNIQPFNTSIKLNYTDKIEEPIEDIKSWSAKNWEALSQKDCSQYKKEINNLGESSHDCASDDKRFIAELVFPIKNIPKENSLEDHNIKDLLLSSLKGKCGAVKNLQQNIESTSETPLQSTTNKIEPRVAVFCKYDEVKLAEDIYSEKAKENKNHPNSSISNAISLDESVSVKTNECGNPDMTFENGKTTNIGLKPTLENIDFSCASTKSYEKENSWKEPSTSLNEKPIFSNHQCGNNTGSHKLNEAVCSKACEKEPLDYIKDTSYSTIYNKVQTNKKSKTEKQLSKCVDVVEEKVCNRSKIKNNFKENLYQSETQNKNKSNLGTVILNDLLNDTSCLSNELSSLSKVSQKLNRKSTELLAKKNKSHQVISSKEIRQTKEALSKSNSKQYLKNVIEGKCCANTTNQYSSCLKKENKDISYIKDNEQSTTLLTSKYVKDSFNKSKNMTSGLSPNITDKFKRNVKKLKNVVVVKSDYVKYVENKEWFLGSTSKSVIPKCDTNNCSGNTKEKPNDNLKFASFNLTGVHLQKRKNRASPGNMDSKNKELKEVCVAKENLSYNQQKSHKLKKRSSKMKTGIKDPKTNKNCDLRELKPFQKILDYNTEQDTEKPDQKEISSVCVKKQTAASFHQKVDGKVIKKFDNAIVNLINKREKVLTKTKQSFKLNRPTSPLQASCTPLLSKENIYGLLAKTKNRKDNSPLSSVENQSAIQSILKNRECNKELNKTRKLHSKKLGSKCLDLKMYGEEKCFTPTSDVCSLNSVHIQVGHRNEKNGVSTLPSRIETRKSSERNLRTNMVQSTKKLFPNAVLNRNVCTVNDTANIIMNYICKKFSTTAVKNIENNYFGLRASFPKGKVNADNLFKMNGRVLAKTKVKRTKIRSDSNKNTNTQSEHVVRLKRKENHSKSTSTVSLEKRSEGVTPVPSREPLTKKKDYTFEVLYERSKTKSKDGLIKTLKEGDSELCIKKTKYNKCGALKTSISKNFSHVALKPFQGDDSNRVKSSVSDNTNTNSTQLKELYNDDSNAYTKLDNMSDRGKCGKNSKERIFKVKNKDLLTVKHHEIAKLTSYNKLNNLQKEHNKNDKIANKVHTLRNTRESLSEKSFSNKPKALKNNLRPLKKMKSQPNLKNINLKFIDLLELKPLKWRSKSDRLNNFLFRTNRSEVRKVRKRTLIKPPINHNELKNFNTVAIIDNNQTGNKLDLVNTKSKYVQTSTSKENNALVNTLLQNGKKQLDAFSYKTNILEKTADIIKQNSVEGITVINNKQKLMFPLDNKSVSKPNLNSYSRIQSSVLRKNYNTDNAEFMEESESKPMIYRNKITIGSVPLDSSTTNKLVCEKNSETNRESKRTVDKLENCQGKNYFKTYNSKVNLNKNSTLMQTISTNYKDTSKMYEQAGKNENEKHVIKLNKSKGSEKTNKTKTIQNKSEINNGVIKMEEELKPLASAFELNFNLPFNIMAHKFKSAKDSLQRHNKENPESTKESNVMKYHDPLQLLKTAIPNKQKQEISVMDKEEDTKQVTSKRSPKLKQLSSFTPIPKPIPTKKKCKPVQTDYSVKELQNNIARNELSKNIESHNLYQSGTQTLHWLPSNYLNTKSHHIKVKLPIKKQENSYKTNTFFVTGADKKTNSKPPRFPVGLLAKHGMKTERMLIANGGKRGMPNKLEKQNLSNSYKILKNTKAEPKKLYENIRLKEEKENKSDTKKDMIKTTGSNLAFKLNELINKKRKDTLYLPKVAGTANIKHNKDEGSVNGEKIQQVSKHSKNMNISTKLGNKKIFASNKCIEKIVDYGVDKNRGSLLHKGLINSLKMIRSSKTLTENLKAKNLKNKAPLADSSDDQKKIPDKLPSPEFSAIGTKNFLSSNGMGKIKNIIKSKNTFKVLKGKKTMKKRQLKFIERHHQLQDSLQNKCGNKVQLQSHNKTAAGNCIYYSPADPRSKGIYVLQVNPSKTKAVPINSSLKNNRNAIPLKNNLTQYNIPNKKLKEHRSLQ